MIRVQATRLEKAADEEDVEECVCMFEEFQGRPSLDELVGNHVVVALGDSFEMLIHLISTRTRRIDDNERDLKS
jgi:hypothetical protein